MKNKNKLRNAIIKVLGGFTEHRAGSPDILPAGIIGKARTLKIIEVKSGVKIEAAEVSDMRMKILIRQRLAEELDRLGFIKYERKDDLRGPELIATIYVGKDDRQEQIDPLRAGDRANDEYVRAIETFDRESASGNVQAKRAIYMRAGEGAE